jgi:hypothetical protein
MSPPTIGCSIANAVEEDKVLWREVITIRIIIRRKWELSRINR